jgi:hypothetical protein
MATLLENSREKLQAWATSAKLDQEATGKLLAAVSGAKEVDFQPAGISRSVALSAGGDSINIFKTFSSDPKGHEGLLEALGELTLLKAGDLGKQVWERKLVFAAPETANDFDHKLKSGNFSLFKSLVESFDGAVQRLEALHYANALISNGVAIGDAKNLNIFEWSATKDMAGGKVPYSLVPLVSAYCDSDQWKSFPKAFAAYVLGTLACGRNDVKGKFEEVIKSVIELA